VSEEIFCMVKNGVAVTFHRPEKRNAHNLTVLDGRTQSFLHPSSQG
jgi:hypothetical protein